MLTPSKLDDNIYLISFGGKGSNSTPSPNDKGHNLGGQLERTGLGEKTEFCKKCKNNAVCVTVGYILKNMHLFSPWYRAVEVHIYVQEDLLVQDMAYRSYPQV